jgi:predicted PurR-regulated permease PerM
MMTWIQRFSPFPNEVDLLFVGRIRSMVMAMFLSIFVIALAQALVMGIFFWIAGVTPIVLWIFLSFLSGTLPFGNFIIAVPVGIYLIANGNLAGGWILILGYILIVSNMDTIMRPKLIPQNSSLVYVLALLASLGGLALFGYLGVIYGPVIMAVFVTAIDVYLKYYTASEGIQPGLTV